MNILGGVVDTIKDWFVSLVENTVFRVFYWLEILCVKLLQLVEDTMMIFTGEKTVTYDTKSTSLIDVFFNHSSVRGIYAAIAVIGIIFAFAFAIIAVIRRIVDLRDKQQGVTMGTIIGNLLKSILLIFAMNAIVIVSLTATTVLTQQISVAVQNGQKNSQNMETKYFTNEQYAAMGRIINTIGNYSLNQSYRSRYNLNSCYNDIRADLQYLGDQGVFDYHYTEKDGKANWQMVMENLATAYNYTQEAPIDSYDDGLTNAILNAIEIFQANPNMMALSSFKPETKLLKESGGAVPMDRIIFLVGTMGTIGSNAGARNDQYNKDPSFTDPVRYPFYYGERDIYDYDQVRESFNPSPGKTNYILVYAVTIALLMEMLIIVVTCAVRIFNLLTLYLSAPLFIAASPLDDGGKMKQWTTAFMVQLLGVVGMVLSMRLFIMFLPIIWSPNLKITDNMLLECIVKAIITYGAVTAINKVNGILNGILADNAGYQAILAGDQRSSVEQSAIGRGLGSLSASNIGGAIGGAVTGAAGNVARKWGSAAAEATGLAGVGRGIRNAAEAVGIIKAHDQDKDPETVKESRKRGQQRDKAQLQKDYDYAQAHGTTRSGKEITPKDLRRMEHTLAHMEAGKSLSEAKQLAAVDMKEDTKDSMAEARQMQRELPHRFAQRRAGEGPAVPGPGGGVGPRNDDDHNDHNDDHINNNVNMPNNQNHPD